MCVCVISPLTIRPIQLFLKGGTDICFVHYLFAIPELRRSGQRGCRC